MANVNYTATVLNSEFGRSWLVTWTPLTHANLTGTAWDVASLTDRTVQVSGTFDSATVVLEGSNDGTTYATLKDPFGNAVSFTAAGMAQTVESCRYVRPRHSGGTSVESLTITMTAIGKRG